MAIICGDLDVVTECILRVYSCEVMTLDRCTLGRDMVVVVLSVVVTCARMASSWLRIKHVTVI
jgi:hypothetical protein